MKHIGVMRVVTATDPDFINCHQRIMQGVCPPDIAWESRCLPEQPEGIHNAKTFALALPKILALGKAWQKEIDLLAVSCAADPGVKQLQALLDIPVFGAGSACCEIAKTKGERIGILGIEEQMPAVFAENLQGNTLFYHRPQGIHCTHDIHSDAGKKAIIDAAIACEKEGAGVIALACTGMATTNVAELVAPYTALPVINPVLAMGKKIAMWAAPH